MHKFCGLVPKGRISQGTLVCFWKLWEVWSWQNVRTVLSPCAEYTSSCLFQCWVSTREVRSLKFRGSRWPLSSILCVVREVRASAEAQVVGLCQGAFVPLVRERGDLGIGVSHARALSKVIHGRYIVMLVNLLAVVILWCWGWIEFGVEFCLRRVECNTPKIKSGENK